MSSNTAPQIQCKTASETRNVAVGFLGKLDSGELLTGSPTVTDASGDLTIDNEAVSSSALTIDSVSHLTGQAVQFNVAGGAAGTTYTVKIVVATDGSPAQSLIANVRLRVTSDS